MIQIEKVEPGQLSILSLLFALLFPPETMYGDTSLIQVGNVDPGQLSILCLLFGLPFPTEIMYGEKHAGNDIPITCIHQRTTLQSLHTVINLNIIGDNVGQSVLHNTSKQ